MRVSVARKSKRQSDPSTLRKLKAALTELSFTPPALSFAEGETYVCSTCRLPVRQCNTNPDKRCASTLLEGTELNLIRKVGKGKSVVCIRCGGPIPKKSLEKNPLTELCPSCQKASSKVKSPKRSKGAPQ
jgi:Zn finger protein HypA/HybF involved in hydrogenase expression